MTVKHSPYSGDFVAAYRVIVQHSKDSRETIIVINSTASEERQYEALLQLIDYGEEYSQYGFIAICGDNQLFLEERFALNEEQSNYVYRVSNHGVVHIAALKALRFNKELIGATGG
jgi:hypothetical protein